MAPKITLFAPEHFYLFNTLAVPQLTGYLLEHGYEVQQRVLDNEFTTFVATEENLRRALSELEALRPAMSAEQLAYLAASIELARLPEQLGYRATGGDALLAGLLRRRGAAARLLHGAEAQLRERFLGVSKDRFLLALARLQAAVDLHCAPFWPSTFGLLDGLVMPHGAERSKQVRAASEDDALNPLLGYYRRQVVPSVPADTLLAGISITHEAQVIPAFTLARAIREQRPDLHITLGGASVSTFRETLAADNPLSSLYDSMVVGAGEESLVDLLEALATSATDLGHIPSLAWRRPDGTMQRNPDRADVTLDHVATPVFTDPRPNPILTLASSSGCDWARCRFCHFPKILSDETQYCTRSPEAFIRDVATLTERHRPAYFHLCDTNLSVGQLATLADALLEARCDARFYSFVRAERAFADLEFCRRIRSAGFFALHFGLESGSQEVLNRAHKGIDLDVVSTVIDNFAAADIITSVFLMIGVPGETPADVDKTVAFMSEHLGKIRGEVAMCRFYLDLFSEIYDDPEAFGVQIVPDPEADLDSDVSFRNPSGYNEEDMEGLVDDFYARVGLPRSYGERFVFEMLESMCPDGVGQKTALYAPFVWGGVKRAMPLLSPRGERF